MANLDHGVQVAIQQLNDIQDIGIQRLREVDRILRNIICEILKRGDGRNVEQHLNSHGETFERIVKKCLTGLSESDRITALAKLTEHKNNYYKDYFKEAYGIELTFNKEGADMDINEMKDDDIQVGLTEVLYNYTMPVEEYIIKELLILAGAQQATKLRGESYANACNKAYIDHSHIDGSSVARIMEQHLVDKDINSEEY